MTAEYDRARPHERFRPRLPSGPLDVRTPEDAKNYVVTFRNALKSDLPVGERGSAHIIARDKLAEEVFKVAPERRFDFTEEQRRDARYSVDLVVEAMSRWVSTPRPIESQAGAYVDHVFERLVERNLSAQRGEVVTLFESPSAVA